MQIRLPLVHFLMNLIKVSFSPSEPDVLSAHFAEISVPVLTRSDRELDDTRRREKMIMSHRGMRKPRRCLWQLPKIMVRLMAYFLYIVYFSGANE